MVKGSSVTKGATHAWHRVRSPRGSEQRVGTWQLEEGWLGAVGPSGRWGRRGGGLPEALAGTASLLKDHRRCELGMSWHHSSSQSHCF